MVPGPESLHDLLPVTAAVLAGGRSMRMGVDKTLLAVDGEPLVARVVEAVGEVCAHTLIVTNRPDALAEAGLPPEVPVLTDEVAYQGPLGGLVTALKDAPDDWVLAVAADMPWLQPAVVRALWDARDGAQVVVPVTEKGTEPLLALYHRSCLPVARRVLETGRRRLVAMFAELTVVEVPVELLRDADPELVSLFNVNTPDDLLEARESAPAPERPSIRPVVVHAAEERRAGRMPVERPVTIFMNDVEVATTQATPTDLEELALGFLLAEGLVADRDALRSVDTDRKRGLVYVETDESVPDELVYKTRYLTSGCGTGVTFSSVGHARNLAKVTTDVRVEADALHAMMREMSAQAAAYRDTGGMHSCGLGRAGSLLLVREDVGRHNAVDKLLGRAWLDGVATSDAVLLTTGRISYEMAVKAAKARVPVVVSRSAVTDLAAEIGEELGITLAGYCRGGGIVLYTHAWRVASNEDANDDEGHGA